MNNTYFIGRLVTDPELKELENDKKVVNVTIAVPRSYKNKDGEYDADFLDCTFWDHNADYVSKMEKGNKIAVQGRTETKLYEKDGKTFKDYKVVVDHCEDLDYVKTITAHYRLLIDNILNDKDLKKSSSGYTKLLFNPDIEKTFYRGSTTYCLKQREKN